jgi:hypothetical protein
MDIATIEPALCALAASITGLPAAACIFENAPRPFAPVLCLLSWISRIGRGQDGTRWTYAAATDPLSEMTPTVEGLREAHLQIAVEVLADQRPGYNAASVIEHARTRLSRPSSLAALEAVGLALAPPVGPATQADYSADSHIVSRSLFDLHLNAMATETDTTTSYIDSADIEGTVYGPDGVTAETTTLQPSTVS